MNLPASRIETADGDLPFAVDYVSGPIAIVRPSRSISFAACLPAIRPFVEAELPRTGAFLFRGFEKLSAEAFNDVITGFGKKLVTYDYGSTPRRQIANHVYSSTEYPAHQWIPQHNEQSYTTKWPARIYFYCDLPATEGGETPISDSRVVYQSISPSIRDRFARKQLMYVRNYANGLDLPWSQVFRTEDPRQVEAFCRQHDISYEWLPDGGLRTRQICQSEARHPVSGAAVWFNQAHLFHVSALDASLRETLLSIVSEADLPRNVYYGDGSAMEESVLDEIRSCYRQATIAEAWQEGDLLVLDNMLFAHGRAPFQGNRRILVGMAGNLSNSG